MEATPKIKKSLYAASSLMNEIAIGKVNNSSNNKQII